MQAKISGIMRAVAIMPNMVSSNISLLPSRDLLARTGGMPGAAPGMIESVHPSELGNTYRTRREAFWESHSA